MTERDLPRWEELYRTTDVEKMPWYQESLDNDFAAALEERGISAGAALDLGSGPGTQAMALAKMGFRVTATDISPSAIEQATSKAREQGLDVVFRQDDILDSHLEGSFDIIFDRGLFHVLEPDRRGEYVATAHNLLKPSGLLFLKCFSHKEKGAGGPYRLSPDEIRANFEASFNIESMSDTDFQGTLATFPKALFTVMSRI